MGYGLLLSHPLRSNGGETMFLGANPRRVRKRWGRRWLTVPSTIPVTSPTPVTTRIDIRASRDRIKLRIKQLRLEISKQLELLRRVSRRRF